MKPALRSNNTGIDSSAIELRLEGAELEPFRQAWAAHRRDDDGSRMLLDSARSFAAIELDRLPPFVRQRLDAIPELIARGNARLEALMPGIRPLPFGHFGDGNVHLNVFPPTGAGAAPADETLAQAKAVLNACVDRHGGSISAEHGIGRLKRADFDARLHEPARTMLRGLKSTLDPDGRMNPGALHV